MTDSPISETPLVAISILIGKDLGSFKLVRMYEVYSADAAGRKSRSIGFFSSQPLAAAFAGNYKGGDWSNQVCEALVLTDGKVGWDVSQSQSTKFFDDEAETVRLRTAALAKLDPAERTLLGFSEPSEAQSK